MANRFKTARLIVGDVFSSVITTNGKTMTIGIVTNDGSFVRPLPSNPQVKDDFLNKVEELKDTFKPETVQVALKNFPHVSKADNREHITVVGIDANGDVCETRHMVLPKRDRGKGAGGGSDEEEGSGDEVKSPGKKRKSPGKEKLPVNSPSKVKSPKKSPVKGGADDGEQSSDEERFRRDTTTYTPF